MQGVIMKTYHYHQLVRLCWKLVVPGILTWMNGHHGHFLSMGLLLLKLQLRFLLIIIFLWQDTYSKSLIYSRLLLRLQAKLFLLTIHLSYCWKLVIRHIFLFWAGSCNYFGSNENNSSRVISSYTELKLENIRTAWLLKRPVQLCNLGLSHFLRSSWNTNSSHLSILINLIQWFCDAEWYWVGWTKGRSSDGST